MASIKLPQLNKVVYVYTNVCICTFDIEYLSHQDAPAVDLHLSPTEFHKAVQVYISVQNAVIL
jgi:hypothetical protein